MGKHIKTEMDTRFINSLAIEVYKLDPKNNVLNTLMNLPNYEGGELRKTINHQGNIRTVAEHSKDKTMTRKVDTYEYESLEKMIVKDELPMSEIAEIFTDKTYYNWYAERNFK